MENRKLTEAITYNSSTIVGSVYTFATQNLQIVFKSAVCYEYENVSLEDYLQFSNSDSVGRSFAEIIRKYEGKKVNSQYER